MSCRASNEGVTTVAAPFLCVKNIPFSAYTWNFTTVPQTSLEDRALTYARGRILGGSSSLSALVRRHVSI